MADDVDGARHLTNGRYQPGWFRIGRQMIIFLMGVGILLYAVVSQGHDVPFLVTGLVLIGIVPVEDFLVRQRQTLPAPSSPPSETPSHPPDTLPDGG